MLHGTLEQVFSALLDLQTRALALVPESVQDLSSAVTSNARLTSSAGVLVGITTWTAYSYLRSRNNAPGPTRLPLLGNVLQMPTKMQSVQFTKWSQTYGPIFSLDIIGQHMVVVNSHKVAGDLFDRRSQIYSDRPRLIMAGEILTGGIFMVFARWGNLLRSMRRAAHESFNPKAVGKYELVQAKAAAEAACRIISQPDSWEDSLKQFAASAILTSVYGWPPIGPDEPIVGRLVGHIAHLSGAVLPGAFLVDLIPIMKLIPAWLAKWKREGIAWHDEETRLFQGLNDDVAKKMAAGEAQPSVIAELLESENRHGLSDKEAAWFGGVLITTGTETTSTTLLYFFLAMVAYPDVLRKAQAELDAVVGRGRAPTFNDMADLPYIKAMVKETLRWRPVVRLTVPHATIEELSFLEMSGMAFAVWINLTLRRTSSLTPYTHLRDPAIYPDFDVFRPERFLDATGKIEVTPPGTHQMGHVSYGFGRRNCPGMYFANQSIFIVIATMLWAFDIRAPVDQNGNAVLPNTTDCVDLGIVIAPVPFKCQITPRFREAEAILESSVASMC
ncbi:cytochrome P450 [Cytidiella melzeri]|nr:cytochrome P450 [Cytidiella melzeri]